MGSTQRPKNQEPAAELIQCEARPERKLIRPGGCNRYLDFVVKVGEMHADATTDRSALNLALVLDRSGSMNGEKIATAKSAALAVLDRLDERDRVAVVVFDDKIDTVQPAAQATPQVKARARSALQEVQARANTALHQGWLTGCQAIALDGAARAQWPLSRCFLLTDGLANVGVTNPERIAGEAAGVRENAGIGTSTFGIGPDYDENLLAPMAVAGGGQFHHLRTTAEIASTFVGELGDLLAVAAGQVQLEIEADPGTTADLVSQYWLQPSLARRPAWTVSLGDLLANEERHVVVRFTFPAGKVAEARSIRVRVLWTEAGASRQSAWHELWFDYAEDSVCEQERRDLAVMHWAGMHESERARREATDKSRRGDLQGASRSLRVVNERFEEFTVGDPELREALQDLMEFEPVISSAPASPMVSKEVFFQTQRRSRGQKDYR